MLGECTPTLLASHAALSQLDCLIAFARGATLYDLRRPNLVKEQVIRLKGSRHALKALSDESFVSILDDKLGDTSSLTLLPQTGTQ